MTQRIPKKRIPSTIFRLTIPSRIGPVSRNKEATRPDQQTEVIVDNDPS